MDLGATVVSGMHVRTVYLLRQALGLDKPGTPVKVTDPVQMLGEIKLDLIEALGVDVVALTGTGTTFGFKNEGWKEWAAFDGTPVLVPAGFNTVPEPAGDLLMYPEGDRKAAPSARMPGGGFYFDSIVRQPPIDESKLKVEDNLEEFALISDEEAAHFAREAERLHKETDKAIMLNFSGLALGNIARVPGPGLKNPKGIRDVEEWYISLSTRRDYIYEVFERQTEINLASLEKVHQGVGDRANAIYWTGTDFGAQNGPFISPKTYRDLFMPFHKQINNWIHQHTPWKTFIHSCGSVWALIEDFIAAGFDILNPVQISAADMIPAKLKERFGDRIVFWGGGVDTQQTLPFGTVDAVRNQVRENLRAFSKGGGYIFNAVHNIQALVPVPNVLAMYAAAREFGAG
jgi:Uroporphyrinogen decarboxylase (URO-D)